MPEHRAYGNLQHSDSMEFSVTHTGLEDCPSTDNGKHVVIKPAEYTSLSAMYFAEISV